MSFLPPARYSLWKGNLVLAISLFVLSGTIPEQTLIAKETAGAQGEASKSDRSKLLLKYGDGKPDGKKSIAGAGEMIRFELPEEKGKVRALRVHGARYGYPQPPKEDVEISLLGEDMTEVLHTELVPYSLFKRVKKGRWTYLPFRDNVEVPQKFWVVLNFNAEKTKGVYVSYDTSTMGEYSRIGLTEEDARETDFAGDWMIQVLLAN